ncbi:MAG: hypothetical protein A2X45_21245 [Lentisphaerae bacterium GWF2_50_93]|nr:MAG: hypothetical protein A2X45_21245 [Lentisphaerae bacterium GWF2_50_93]
MNTRIAVRFVLAVAVIMIGIVAFNSLAADDAKGTELSKALAKVKMFAGLTGAERESLKSAAMLRKAKAGELIIGNGKMLDRMYFILDGQIEVWMKGKCIETATGQSLVGEFEYLEKGPTTAEVRVSKDVELIEMNYVALTTLMEKQPRIGYVLMREIAKSEIQRILANNPK